MTNTLKNRLPGFLKSELAKDSTLSFIFLILEKGLAFLFHVYVARILLSSGFGVYSYLMSILSILFVVAQLGTQTYVTREIAACNRIGDFSRMKGVIISVLIVLIASSLVLLSAYYAVSFLFSSNHLLFQKVFKIAIVLVPLQILVTFNSGLLLALNRIGPARFPNAVLIPLLSIFLVFVYSNRLDVELLFLIRIAVYAGSLIIAFGLAARVVPVKRSIETSYRFNELFAVSVPMVLANSVFLINYKTDILVLGYYVSHSGIGVYAAAAQLAMLASLGRTAINMVFAPRISAELAKGSVSIIEELSGKASLYAAAFSALVLIGFLPVGQQVLGIYGDGFSRAYWIVVVLLGGQLINSYFGPVGVILTMSGKQNVYLKFSVFCLVFNIIANIFLIRFYGLMGAAIATSLSMVLWNLLMHRYIVVNLKFNTIYRHSGKKQKGSP